MWVCAVVITVLKLIDLEGALISPVLKLSDFTKMAATISVACRAFFVKTFAEGLERADPIRGGTILL